MQAALILSSLGRCAGRMCLFTGFWYSGVVVRSEGGALLGKEVALDYVRGEFDGPVVGGYRVVAAAGTREQVGAGGVVRLVVLERGRVDLGESVEPLGRPVESGDGHRPVQGGDGAGTECAELVVEGHD